MINIIPRIKSGVEAHGDSSSASKSQHAGSAPRNRDLAQANHDFVLPGSDGIPLLSAGRDVVTTLCRSFEELPIGNLKDNATFDYLRLPRKRKKFRSQPLDLLPLRKYRICSSGAHFAAYRQPLIHRGIAWLPGFSSAGIGLVQHNWPGQLSWPSISRQQRNKGTFDALLLPTYSRASQRRARGVRMTRWEPRSLIFASTTSTCSGVCILAFVQKYLDPPGSGLICYPYPIYLDGLHFVYRPRAY